MSLPTSSPDATSQVDLYKETSVTAKTVSYYAPVSTFLFRDESDTGHPICNPILS